MPTLGDQKSSIFPPNICVMLNYIYRSFTLRDFRTKEKNKIQDGNNSPPRLPFMGNDSSIWLPLKLPYTFHYHGWCPHCLMEKHSLFLLPWTTLFVRFTDSHICPPFFQSPRVPIGRISSRQGDGSWQVKGVGGHLPHLICWRQACPLLHCLFVQSFLHSIP